MDQFSKCGQKNRPGGSEFFPMNGSQTAQKLFTTRSDPRMHLTSIGFTGLSFDVAPIAQSIYQFNRGVVPEPHPLRQDTNSWCQFRRKTLNGKQQLVLLAVQAICLCSLFAECEKVPDLVAEFCESLIFLRIHLKRLYIALRYLSNAFPSTGTVDIRESPLSTRRYPQSRFRRPCPDSDIPRECFSPFRS